MGSSQQKRQIEMIAFVVKPKDFKDNKINENHQEK